LLNGVNNVYIVIGVCQCPCQWRPDWHGVIESELYPIEPCQCLSMEIRLKVNCITPWKCPSMKT